MKKILCLIPAMLLMLACSVTTDKEETFVSHLRILVQESGTKAMYNSEDASVQWEEGDAISFQIYAVSPDVSRDLLFDEDFLFSKSGKLVLENGAWRLFETNDSSTFRAETIEIESSSKDAPVIIDYQYENGKMNGKNPDWFTIRYVMSVPFQEGEMTVSFDPANLFSSRGE